jgi:hypothetical protein
VRIGGEGETGDDAEGEEKMAHWPWSRPDCRRFSAALAFRSNCLACKVRVSMRAYNALMTNRQHDIVVLVMIWLLSILAGLTLGLNWLKF